MAIASDGEAAGGARQALIDGHVHIHPEFDLARMLDAAARNFDDAARALGWATRPPCVIMLTEIAGVDRFAEFAAGGGAGDWRFEATAEPVSASATRGDGAPILIIAGRQVATGEGLELLAQGVRETFPEGGTLRDALAAANAAGALTSLPWGVGKWSGARGALIASLIAEKDLTFDVGDSGVRAQAMARPALFAEAEAAGRRVLAGTDPLAFDSEVEKPGRFGMIMEAPLDTARPFASITAWLDARGRSPDLFGRLEALPRFVMLQAGMQIRKRLKRR